MKLYTRIIFFVLGVGNLTAASWNFTRFMYLNEAQCLITGGIISVVGTVCVLIAVRAKVKP